MVCRAIRFKELLYCFIYKLLLDWCEETQDKEGKYIYKDKLLPVVLISLRSWRVRDMVKAEFRVNIEDKKAFYYWLGVKRQFHRIKGINIYTV